MKHQLLTIGLFLISTCLTLGQNYPAKFCEPDFLGIKKIHSKDSILVPCDTIYILNTATLAFYKNLNDNASDTNGELTQLLQQTRVFYEGHIKLLESDYDKLMTNYNSVFNSTTEFNELTKNRLGLIQNSLQKADNQLELVNQNLTETQNLLKKERWNLFGRKILWGVGGVGVGLVTGVLLFN